MSGLVESTLAKRVQGDRPSPLRAVLTAAAAGAAAAVITYRLIRS